MIALMIFRLLLVIAGIIANYGEFYAANNVYKSLVEAKINGSRLVLASNFMRRALVLVCIQFFLLVPAIIGLKLASQLAVVSFNADVFAGVLGHIAAVFGLMAMGLLSWYDRTLAMDLISSDENLHAAQLPAHDISLLREQVEHVLGELKMRRRDDL